MWTQLIFLLSSFNPPRCTVKWCIFLWFSASSGGINAFRDTDMQSACSNWLFDCLRFASMWGTANDAFAVSFHSPWCKYIYYDNRRASINLETVLIEIVNRKYAQWKHWSPLGQMTYLSGGTGSPGYDGAGAIRATTALHNSTKVEWDSQKSGSHIWRARLFSLAPMSHAYVAFHLQAWQWVRLLQWK